MSHLHGEATSRFSPVLSSEYISLTAQIVTAAVATGNVASEAIPDLISTVHASLLHTDQGGTAPSPTAAPVQAVMKSPAEVRKSITPDFLISFEDGKPYKTLRRHLTMRGITPEQYRAKHGLAVDYPLVSANYSAARSKLAKDLGLGQQRRKNIKPAS